MAIRYCAYWPERPSGWPRLGVLIGEHEIRLLKPGAEVTEAASILLKDPGFLYSASRAELEEMGRSSGIEVPSDLELKKLVLQRVREKRESKAWLSDTRPIKQVDSITVTVQGDFPPFRDRFRFDFDGRAAKHVSSVFAFGEGDGRLIEGRSDDALEEFWQLCHELSRAGFYDLTENTAYPATDLPTWMVEVEGERRKKRIEGYGAEMFGEDGSAEHKVMHRVVCAVQAAVVRIPWQEEIILAGPELGV